MIKEKYTGVTQLKNKHTLEETWNIKTSITVTKWEGKEDTGTLLGP